MCVYVLSEKKGRMTSLDPRPFHINNIPHKLSIKKPKVHTKIEREISHMQERKKSNTILIENMLIFGAKKINSLTFIWKFMIFFKKKYNSSLTTNYNRLTFFLITIIERKFYARVEIQKVNDN